VTPILTNLPRLHARMQASRMDAVVGTAPENVLYISGLWAMTQWIRRGPQAYAVHLAPGRGEACVIVGASAADHLVDGTAWVRDAHLHGRFPAEIAGDEPEGAAFAALLAREPHAGPIEALATALRDRGLARGRIAVDEVGLMPGHWEALADALPEATLLPAAALLRAVRAVKTEEEVARLRRAAQVAEHSVAAALAVAREGATETDLVRAFDAATVAEGGLPVLRCIGTGPRSALPNVQPSDRPLRRGEVIRFDVGGRWGHYRADIARCAVLGEPSPRHLQVQRAIRAGLDHAYELACPGARARDIFDRVMETVRREGLPEYRREHVGHGIGLDGYDAPLLGPSSDEVLEPGMVLCIETPFYALGAFGLQVEDTIVVREGGPETLMSTSADLLTV
jgi:Xaa-Pro aminopeptidase